jgi:hypothetical protein
MGNTPGQAGSLGNEEVSEEWRGLTGVCRASLCETWMILQRIKHSSLEFTRETKNTSKPK